MSSVRQVMLADGSVSAIDQRVTLSDWCRRYSLSLLVPMGQAFSYRYQGALIADLLHALRTSRDRLER